MRARKFPPTEIQWVQQLMAQCHTSTVCEQRIAAKYGVTTRTARTYMRQAWDEIKERNIATRAERRERLRLTLESILDSSMTAEDRKHAILASNALAKLDGLDEPDVVKHEVAGALAFAGETDPEKALQRLQELRQAQEKKPEGDK